MEGSLCYSPSTGCNKAGKKLPVLEYPNPSVGTAVIGGYVYRGSAIPWLRGTYFYSEFCGGQTWTLRWADGAVTEGPTVITTDLIPNFPNDSLILTGYGQDNRGEMYLVDAGNGVGYRIDPE